MRTLVTRVVAVALTVAAGLSTAKEPTAKPGAALQAPAPASSDELGVGPGREKAAQCGACHSFDYIRMNSRFLDLAGCRGRQQDGQRLRRADSEGRRRRNRTLSRRALWETAGDAVVEVFEQVAV